MLQNTVSVKCFCMAMMYQRMWIMFCSGLKNQLAKAIRNFEIAVENGNDFAKYMLGKLYLYGKEFKRDYYKAMEYLTASAEHGNQYAKQFLYSIKSNRNWSADMGSLRLLSHISRIIQNRLEDERKGKQQSIDRKLRRKTDEKNNPTVSNMDKTKAYGTIL